MLYIFNQFQLDELDTLKSNVKQRFLKGDIILNCLLGPTNSVSILVGHQSTGHTGSSGVTMWKQTTTAYRQSKLVQLSKKAV